MKFQKQKIKKGDRVKILAGSDKGKTGKVLRMIPKRDRVVVEGIRTVKRHTKAQGTNPGGIIEKQSPMHISNVALVDRAEKATKASKSAAPQDK